MTKVALVGLGFMGRMHLSIYGTIENVQVTALCDVHEENMDMSRKGGGNIAVGEMKTDLSKARKFTSFKAMLAAGGFDYVDLCIPTHLHKEYAVLAMEAGYDVFCEKPMARTGEEADAMIATMKKTGKLLTIGQCLRFWPMYVKVKELLDSGKYGKVISAELARYSPSPTWSVDGWIEKGELSGSAGLDLHIHDVDMIHWWFGAPKGVTSSGVEAAGGGFGHLATIYDYPGMTVTSVGDWLCVDTFGLIMRALIVMEKAVINLDTTQPKPLTLFIPGEGKVYPELDGRDGYFFELRSFVGNVATRKAPTVVTAEAAMQSLKTALAEIKSAETHKKVTL
ncbi:MAG: Gfo/Idh/MocA family oxidoreductase [Sphaerochaetaceae bacterium]|nr:Gfo/Idh/MocA family oxidoreductase [Sphaerochaetaceae bacterium]